jgi:AAA+ superfamily predicted ATPase
MLTSHMHYFDKDTKSYDVKKIQAEVVQIYNTCKNKFKAILNKDLDDDDKCKAILELAINSSKYNWGLSYELKAREIEENIINGLKDTFGKDASVVFNLLVVNDPEFALTDIEERYRRSINHVINSDKKTTESNLVHAFEYYTSAILCYVKSNGTSFISEDIIDYDLLEQTANKTKLSYKNFQEILNYNFKNYVGLDSIKYELAKIVVKLERESSEKPYNILLTGNPGTGKSTAAKLIHNVLYDCGLISQSHPTIISAAGLQGKYQGHTVKEVQRIFEENKNGLIFLDEFYALVSKTDFNKEAVTELLLQLESEKNAGTIVIAAGYHDKIAEFFESNPGIKSRFDSTINLKDYSLAEMLDITERYIKQKRFEIEDEAFEKLELYYSGEMIKPNFGNARGVRKIVEGVLDYAKLRIWSSEKEPEQKNTIINEDVETYISEVKKNEPVTQTRKMGF